MSASIGGSGSGRIVLGRSMSIIDMCSLRRVRAIMVIGVGAARGVGVAAGMRMRGEALGRRGRGSRLRMEGGGGGITGIREW
jgi:hypothetical protein